MATSKYKIKIVGTTYLLKTHSNGTINYDTQTAGEFTASKQDEPGADAAYVMYYDSTSDDITEVDFTSLVGQLGTVTTEWSAGGDNELTTKLWSDWTGYAIWARRVQTESDVNTRRFWDDAAADEVAVNVKTRTEDSIEWQIARGDNVGLKETGWIRVFDVAGISGGSTASTAGEADTNFNTLYEDSTSHSQADGSNIAGTYPPDVKAKTSNISPDESSNATSGNKNTPNVVPVGAPHLRQIYWWDYARQNKYSSPANALNLGESRGKETDKPLPAGSRVESFDREIFADPPRIAGDSGRIGATDESTGYNAGSVFSPTKEKVEDLLAAVKASDDPRFMQSEDNGIPGLLNRVVRALSQIRTGTDYDQYVFRQVFEASKITGKNYLGQTNKEIETMMGRPRSMRPLYHLDQMYRNWSMATPHVLLAGRIIITTGSNYMWYGPTFNPLGFELKAAQSANNYAVWPPAYNRSTGSNVQGWSGDKLNYFHVRIKVPDGTYVFSVNATYHSSWETNGNTKLGKPWAEQGSDVNARPITVHVGGASQDVNVSWDQDIFLAGGAAASMSAGLPWCYITVIGTNPNYTADYVYRGVKSKSLGGEKLVDGFISESSSGHMSKGAAHAMEATGWADRLKDLATAEREKLGSAASVPDKGYGRDVCALDWSNIGQDPVNGNSVPGWTGKFSDKPDNPKVGGDSNKNAGAGYYEPNSGGWWQWRKPNG